MNTKIFKFMLCLLLPLSVILLSGCERVNDLAMTDLTTDATPALKVGLIHPQPNFTSFGKGAELARTEINHAGGILGMQVEFIFREELTDTVVETAAGLVESENVVALLGPLFSSNAVKVGPVMDIPVLLGAAGANVTETGDFLFLVTSSNALQAKLMAQFSVDELGAETAALIWQNQDVYSIGMINAFEANFQQLGGHIVAKETYEGGDTVFDTQLTAIQKANPDVFFLASFAPENPRIMKQARELEIDVTFVGGEGWDDPLMFQVLADNAPLENSYYCTNLDPSAEAFTSAYEAMFNVPAEGIAAAGYDAMRLLAIAIEAAASTDPIAIREAIAGITHYQGATRISHYDENRHPDKSVGVFQIINGQPEPYKVVGTERTFEIRGTE